MHQYDYSIWGDARKLDSLMGKSPPVVKYTRAQGLRAMRLYEQYDCSTASVIDELGYPSREMLVQWHKAWLDGSRDGEQTLGDRRGNVAHLNRSV